MKITRKQFDQAVASEQKVALMRGTTMTLSEAEARVNKNLSRSGTIVESAPASRREIIQETTSQSFSTSTRGVTRRSVDPKKLAKGFERLGLSSDAAEVAAGVPNNEKTAKNLSSYLGVSQAVASQMLKDQ